MITWKRSEIEVGTELKISADLFQEPSKVKQHLISCKYLGETSRGILVDCKFVPAVGSKEPDAYHYRRFISWASIYCGDVKVSVVGGYNVRARKEIA